MTVLFYSKLLTVAALLCTFSVAHSQTAPGDLSEEAAALRALIEEYEKNGGKVSSNFDEPAPTLKPAAAPAPAPDPAPDPAPTVAPKTTPAPASTPMPSFAPREIKPSLPTPKLSTPPALPKPEIKPAVEKVKQTAADTMKIERPAFSPRASDSVVIQDAPPAPTPKPAPTIKKQVKETSSIVLNDAAASGTAAAEKEMQPAVDAMKEAVKPVVTEATTPEEKPAPAIAKREPTPSKPKLVSKIQNKKKSPAPAQTAPAQTGAVFRDSNPKPKTEEEIEKEESTPIASARQIGNSNTGATGFFAALNRNAQRRGSIFKRSQSSAGTQEAPAKPAEERSSGGLFSGLIRGNSANNAAAEEPAEESTDNSDSE